ncbi:MULTISPECIES: HutD family protein [unclassified Streptomyces]|uniref:HutD/Ves family protein n=1 Tax=unclassified Streptomyces TaxID=2593676 RepID=UPI000DC79447|nr:MULTISPECIES: HutD family protein [unclassified Streptomyces]AWZ06832.1 HutD family protein [Streptomyces sp. ICC4]AWZ12683.1 HutD family protein [Streptomyces sp. ICC1]
MTSEAAIRILRAAGRPAAGWKNGGGVTREIAAWPEGAGMDDFAWRASLAEVTADGPFSVFPGVDRTLTLAEGAGMDLRVAGVRRLVDRRLEPREFPGDQPTDCRLLGGPVVNFNVMYRRGAVSAATAVVRGALALTVGPGETLLVVALEGSAEVGGSVELGTYDAALVTGPRELALRSSGCAAVVRLAPVPDPDPVMGRGQPA